MGAVRKKVFSESSKWKNFFRKNSQHFRENSNPSLTKNEFSFGQEKVFGRPNMGVVVAEGGGGDKKLSSQDVLFCEGGFGIGWEKERRKRRK